MTGLFIRILNMSLTAGMITLVVMGLRLLFHRAPRIFSYALWAVVLFRLLCPVSFVSDFSLLSVLHAPTAESGYVEYISQEPDGTGSVTEHVFGEDVAESWATTAGERNADRYGDAAAEDARERAVRADAWQTFLRVGSWVWLAGALGMLLFGAVSYGRLLHRMRREKAEGENEPAYEKMTPHLRICQSDAVPSPFVLGFVSPCIYLPAGLTEKELEYILLHERIHIQRGDPLTRAAAYLALCLHWFNPLVWLAFFLSGRDMEMSCDEAVIRRLGGRVKKEYSASLLSLASGRRIAVGIPLAFGEGEPGKRIKHVLRYKKPAFALVGAALAVCVLAAVFLSGNPGKPKEQTQGQDQGPEQTQGQEQTQTQEQVFYGVIQTSKEFGGLVVVVPQYGEMVIPDAETVEPYIEMDFQGIEEGQLVRIAFLGDEAVEILETYPEQFSRAADSIQVMGVGFGMRPEPDGNYLFTVPLGMAPDAQTGDTLRIYHAVLSEGTLREDYHRYLLESPEKIRTEQLARTRVTEVDAENYDIWVVLPREALRTFLSEFGFGVSCELEAAGQEGKVPDGSYWIYARSVNRSARCFDSYETDMSAEDGDGIELVPAFADECTFLVNQELDSVRFEEVGFDEFADRITDAADSMKVPVLCTFRDNRIVEAQLLSGHLSEGISYMPLPEGGSWIEDIVEMEGTTLKEVLSESYELVRTEEADVSDAPGTERIEIYLGDIGDGDSGILLIYDASGNLLDVDDAHHARAGWANFYAGELEGTPYLLSVHIEDRDDYGEYWYQVFRLDADGTPRQIAGSDFQWGGNYSYDDDLFHEWADRLENYLAHSRLLLSSQDGELRTEDVSEADRYNYETLRR